MMPIDIAGDPSDWVVLYDSECGFCRWSLARLLALDRHSRLRPIALGTAEADALLADLTLEERAASWHLVAPDGRRWSAGAAAPPLLRLLPRGSAPAVLLERAPELTDRAYRWVAEHRSAFSKLIPEAAERRADARIAQAADARAADAQATMSSGSWASM